MGALEDYEDAFTQGGMPMGGALSADSSTAQSVSPEDPQARKDIFNKAAQRLLQARQAMTQPYAGHDLGNEAFSTGLMGSAPSMGELVGNAIKSRTAAEEAQREAQQQFSQQQQGVDLQAEMARILGGGGSIEDAAALANIGGADKIGKNLSESDIARKTLEMGKYLPIKDAFGNVTAVLNAKTGQIVSPNGSPSRGNTDKKADENTDPSDPQTAAQLILDEAGTPVTPMVARQDIIGRNAQAKAYRDAANAAKASKQQMDILDAQTGKYTPGKVGASLYSSQAALGQGGKGATARAEADKASKSLANSFMQANVGAKGAGIRMVEFDAGAVPNADMPDDARTNLIKVNKAIADSQIQRAAISDLYPRMHLSNVNAIMDNYEAKNPPLLPDGSPNPKWMTYKDWLKAGRPNTAADALASAEKPASRPTPEQARAILEARRKSKK